MLKQTQSSILKTIVYFDLFHYPLTKEELWYFLHEARRSKKTIQQEVKNMHEYITQQDELIFLKKNLSYVFLRKKRMGYATKKWHRAKRIAMMLAFIPTVRFIGVSGGLAMNNTEKNDDIDLFVIVKKDTLWATRAAILLLLDVLGVRRKRADKKVSDKICTNMILSESVFLLPTSMQTLYGAHEVAQIVSLVNKNNTHEKFIKANLWVKKYLPNALRHRTRQNNTQNYSEAFFSVILCWVLRFSALEWLSKTLQLWIMRNYRSKEIITDTLLAFHPRDTQQRILTMYNKNLHEYGIV